MNKFKLQLTVSLLFISGLVFLTLFGVFNSVISLRHYTSSVSVCSVLCLTVMLLYFLCAKGTKDLCKLVHLLAKWSPAE